MAGAENAFHFDIVEVKHLSVMDKNLLIVCFHKRQLICAEDHLSSDFTGEISVFCFADHDLRVSEETLAVGFQSTDMIGILMGDQNVLNGCRINPQPVHFLPEPLIAVTGVNHDHCAVFTIKEDIRNPLPDTGCMFIDPAGIERFENAFSPVAKTHNSFLKL